MQFYFQYIGIHIQKHLINKKYTKHFLCYVTNAFKWQLNSKKTQNTIWIFLNDSFENFKV
jgi:hypothetical protein